MLILAINLNRVATVSLKVPVYSNYKFSQSFLISSGLKLIFKVLSSSLLN